MTINAQVPHVGTGLDPQLARELAAALHGLRYGSIELVVHDGRIVQLERHEKVRFNHDQSRTAT
jgi:hypothetical protein